MRAEVEDDASITKFGVGFKDEVHYHVLPNYFYAKECFHTQITGNAVVNYLTHL